MRAEVRVLLGNFLKWFLPGSQGKVLEARRCIASLLLPCQEMREEVQHPDLEALEYEPATVSHETAEHCSLTVHAYSNPP